MLALLSGAILGVAFLPLPLGFLAWVGYIPLLIALDRHRETRSGARSWFALGYQFGLAFFLVGTHWIALLSNVAITVPWLKYPAWLAAAAYLALFSGLATWIAGTLVRRSALPLTVIFPCVFLFVEELRASGELGFPWFQPGYTQHAYAPVIQLASLGSVTLVTFWVFLLNVLIWRALRGQSRIRAALGAAFLLALPWLWGQRVLDAAPPRDGPVVALVQGNIPGEIKWSGRHELEILDGFLAMSERAVRDSLKPSVVIWPETATGSYLKKQLNQALAVFEFSSREDVPVFSGYADYDFDTAGRPRYYNAAGMFTARGQNPPRYAKRHLVPFGERMPFQGLIPALGKIDLGQAEWTPGRDAVLFPNQAGPFSCLICFESIFPDLAREDVRKGARWLVNITNDEWFGNSSALYQHAAMAVFRAVENHVPLARCANTGLTVLVDSNGRIVSRAPVFQAAIVKGRLPRPSRTTLFTRVGDWPGLAAMIGMVVLFAWPWVRAPGLRALTARERHD